MKFIAQELREIMAKLGFHSIEEMCGHSELLGVKDKVGAQRFNTLDMSRILTKFEGPETEGMTSHFVQDDVFNFELEKTVDEKILLKEFEEFKYRAKGQFNIKVSSTDRTVGTILGSEIQKTFGNSLAEDSFVVNATGGGGQSFQIGYH